MVASWWKPRVRFDAFERLAFRSGGARRGDLHTSIVESADGCYVVENRKSEKALNAIEMHSWAAVLEKIGRLSRLERALTAFLLVLPIDSCLELTLSFPKAALRNAREVLRMEFERRTPFRWNDVYADYQILPNGPDATSLITARLIVIKRSTVDPLARALRKSGICLTGVTVRTADGHDLPINLIATSALRSQTLTSRLDHVIGFSALLASLAFCGLLASQIWRDNSEIAVLDDLEKTETARAVAALRREEANTAQFQLLNALRSRKERVPTFVSLWNELTRVVPDGAWLGDIHQENQVLQISGFARSASDLLALLAASPLFTGVEFTGPVTRDPQSSLERFQIRLSIKNGT